MCCCCRRHDSRSRNYVHIKDPCASNTTTCTLVLSQLLYNARRPSVHGYCQLTDYSQMDEEAAVRCRTDLTFVDSAVSRLARMDFQSPVLISVGQTLKVAVEVIDRAAASL